jgi:hypothetical protein
VPDFVRRSSELFDSDGQTIMSIGQNKDSSHVVGEGGSGRLLAKAFGAPSRDVNSNAARPPDLSIEQGTARSTSHCAKFESK